MSKTGITDPRFYEKDGKSFLRDFFGGLLTTCGLKNKDKKGEYVVLKPFEEYNTYLKFSFGKKF